MALARATIRFILALPLRPKTQSWVGLLTDGDGLEANPCRPACDARCVDAERPRWRSRIAVEWIRQRRRQQGCLTRVQAVGADPEVAFGGGLRAVDAGTPLDHVQVDLEDAPLAPQALHQSGEPDLERLAHVGAGLPEVHVAGALHGDGAGAAHAALALVTQVPCPGPAQRLQVDTPVGEEVRVLRGD